MNGWVELRCPRSLKGKLHPQARIIEIACSQGRREHHGRYRTHDFDYFDADTGQRLHYLEVRFRLARFRVQRLSMCQALTP